MNIYKYQKLIEKNFRRFSFFVAVCLLVLTPFGFVKAETIAPRATFERIWIDYDVMESNQNGMRIHVKFTVYELKNTDCFLGIYFRDASGNPLKDKNKKFYTTQGNVAAFKDL